MTKTYSIEPRGKKFVTLCRDDGYLTIWWYAKNKKLAKKKGDEYLSGKRSALCGYTTKRAEQDRAQDAWERREHFLATGKRL